MIRSRAPTAESEAERATAALRRAAAELERIAAQLREQGRDDEAEIVETGVLDGRRPGARLGGLRGRDGARHPRQPPRWSRRPTKHAAVIASLPDALLAARADDVRSLGRRAARIAAGVPDEPATNGSPYVLVADDLGPADVAELGERLAGIALSGGGVTAHAAIVARSLGIPMTGTRGA